MANDNDNTYSITITIGNVKTTLPLLPTKGGGYYLPRMPIGNLELQGVQLVNRANKPRKAENSDI